MYICYESLTMTFHAVGCENFATELWKHIYEFFSPFFKRKYVTEFISTAFLSSNDFSHLFYLTPS